MADPTQPVETSKDFGPDASGLVTRYGAVIRAYDKQYEPWTKRSKSIIQRYRDERGDNNSSTSARRMNILWSNIQTMQPNLYLRDPKAEVSRRYQDQDPIGRSAAMILERSTTFCQHATNFGEVMRQCRDDYLLTARGQSWVRYVPTYGDKVPKVTLTRKPPPPADPMAMAMPGQPVPGEPPMPPMSGGAAEPPGESYLDPEGKEVGPADVKQDSNGVPYTEGEAYQGVLWEQAVADYIPWAQFGHTPAATWSKVQQVWKFDLMTREALVERFGKDLGSKVPLTAKVEGISDADLQTTGDVYKRGKVYELWDKETRKAIWLCLDYKDGPLDVKEDPLSLKDFFPCPEPLYATTTNDTLVPIPDYAEYQDQAAEIDLLTNRIANLTDALKVRGVYNGDIIELQTLLDGAENSMTAVKKWEQFMTGKGLSGSVDFLPLQEIASTLAQVYTARTAAKQDLYEVTGLSDIIRGQTQPSETATAQRIKGNFATLRLQDRQQAVARFARDTLAIMAEVIAEHFSPETLAEMSGYQMTMQADPQTFMQAVQLLKDDKMRTFRLDVETDSIVAPDQEQEKANTVEFLTSIGGFLEKAMQVGQQVPQLAPLMGTLLMFAVRRFRAGRDVEQTFEQAMAQLEQMGPLQGQPANQNHGRPGMDPQTIAMKAQAEQQTAQGDAMVAQAQQQRDVAKANSEAQNIQHGMELAAANHNFAMAEIQAKTQLLAQKFQTDSQKLHIEVVEKTLSAAPKPPEPQSVAPPQPAQTGLLQRVGKLFGVGQ